MDTRIPRHVGSPHRIGLADLSRPSPRILACARVSFRAEYYGGLGLLTSHLMPYLISAFGSLPGFASREQQGQISCLGLHPSLILTVPPIPDTREPRGNSLRPSLSSRLSLSPSTSPTAWAVAPFSHRDSLRLPCNSHFRGFLFVGLIGLSCLPVSRERASPGNLIRDVAVHRPPGGLSRVAADRLPGLRVPFQLPRGKPLEPSNRNDWSGFFAEGEPPAGWVVPSAS